jgi:hypothetical protein
MPNPAQTRGIRKGLRDTLQAVLAIVAAGGATAVIDLVVGSVDPVVGVILAFVFKIMIAYAQNYLETTGKIGVLLPTPGLVTEKAADAIITTTVGTVDTVTDVVGGVGGTVTGAVVDTTGTVVGSVTSQVGGLIDGVGGITGGVVGTVTGTGDDHDHAQAGVGGCCHTHGGDAG